MRSFPPDVIVLTLDTLLHARFGRVGKETRILQAKSHRLPAGALTPSVLSPDLANPAALGDVVRRLHNETGRWDKASLLLPDSWFRMNVIELPSFNERQGDPKEVIRWALKRTLPIAPEDLRLAWEVLARTSTGVKVLVISALEKTLAAIEACFAAQGIEIVMIESLGLNVWNAIAAAENGAAGDRLFVYVRSDEFTTAVFRGAQPLFLRSRYLSQERSLEQEIRLSSSYIRETLRTATFAQCYVAGNGAAETAVAIGAEFSSPVRTIGLRDVIDEMPEGVSAHDAELTACAGVFTG